MPICEAAHRDDLTECRGRPDAVRVRDGFGGSAVGCVHHGARMLATLTAGTVEPVAVAGAAVDTYVLAKGLPPFDCWNDVRPTDADLPG